jgi:hypothetical protein
MYEPREDGPRGPGQLFWTGLEPAVRAALEAAGHAVRVEGPEPAPLPPPDLARLRRLGPINFPLLEAVQGRDRAMFRYDRRSDIDPAALIAQVALAWPGRKAVVAVKRIDDVRRLCERLCPLLPDVTALSGDDHPPAFGRVVVATFGYCSIAHLDPRSRDFFFALDAIEFAGHENWDVPMFLIGARLYGLLDAASHPAPTVRDRLASLFGFAEAVLPRLGCRERPVIRREVQFNGVAPGSNRADALTVKRSAIWRHHARNRFVARLAERAGDEATADPNATEKAAAAKRNVIVLVEAVEHAIALARFLPGWQVLTGPEIWREGLPGQRSTHTGGPGIPLPPSSVVTFAALAGNDLRNVDVLVRADGGSGIPPVGADALVQPACEGVRPLELVDVVDRHPALRRLVRKRRRAYTARGWHADGVDAEAERVRAFLASRGVTQPRWVLVFPGNKM